VQEPFEFGAQTIKPGTRETVNLPLSLLSDHTPMTIPVHVVHGREKGPRLFLSAAIHGDELNGIEIIRRLLRSPRLSKLRGTLIAVPIVNVFGFIANSRYLPDRRDLNRSFPGSPNGSLTAQLAHLFMQEVVSCCTHGIDLHTGAIHRENLQQIRADLSDPEIVRLARAFSAPLILHSNLRDGSLRLAATDMHIPTILYEAGEALRFDEVSIRIGVRGIIRVMQALDMLGRSDSKSTQNSAMAKSSQWVRAPTGGIFRTVLRTGARIRKDDKLGIIADPFGKSETLVEAKVSGILIGKNILPVVNQGDALFHIAKVDDADAAANVVAEVHEELELDPMTIPE
jgi:predicted deacylase